MKIVAGIRQNLYTPPLNLYDNTYDRGNIVLVLARKPTEKVIITTHDNKIIELTILSVDNKQVKIGIKADPETRIFRQELVEQESTPILA